MVDYSAIKKTADKYGFSESKVKNLYAGKEVANARIGDLGVQFTYIDGRHRVPKYMVIGEKV